jgi:hypothetical protein
MARLAEESERRDAELREKYDRELAETRRFNRQMLTQLEKTYGNLGTALELVGDRIVEMGGRIERMGDQIEENTEEVRSQTRAIMLLLDHFKGPNGGPPV